LLSVLFCFQRGKKQNNTRRNFCGNFNITLDKEGAKW